MLELINNNNFKLNQKKNIIEHQYELKNNQKNETPSSTHENKQIAGNHAKQQTTHESKQIAGNHAKQQTTHENKQIAGNHAKQQTNT